MGHDLFRFDGKRALVVGGASGMGAATARLVHDLGGDVTVVDVQSPHDPVGAFATIDLRERESIDEALATVAGQPIHAVFSCAGVADGTDGLPLVNFVGQRHLLESLIERDAIAPGGAIAMIASIGGMAWEHQLDTLLDLLATSSFEEGAAWFDDHPELAHYGYSKQAVVAYCARRGPELIRRGIRINCTAPGPVMTPLMDANETWRAFESGVFDATGIHGAAPEQQAYPLAFLASEAASYVNGQCLVVDAGFIGGGMTGAVDSPMVAALTSHHPGSTSH